LHTKHIAGSFRRIHQRSTAFSLLPKYRGTAPVNWAIARGETETGAATMKMMQVDTGPIPAGRDRDRIVGKLSQPN
jgi:hypothetical protein